MGLMKGALRSRYLYAAITGLLLACAFPRIRLSGLAWIAPAGMVAAALGCSGWERFRVGYVSGLAFYLVSLSWLLNIPFRWKGIPVGPAAGLVALSAYLALFTALWVWLVTFVTVPRNTPRTFSAAADALAKRGWIARTGLALYAAAAWVGLEMIIARLFTGFPWDLLGVSQYKLIPLIQVATVTGVYGVSFMVIWVGMALLMAAVVLLSNPSARSLWTLEIALPFLVVGLIFSYGFRQTQGPLPPSHRTLKVALLQPSIPQTLIWDTSKNAERFEGVLQLSEAALTNRPDLLIWPESAVPYMLRQDEQTRNAITTLARRSSTWMIIGADDYEIRPGAKTEEDVDYFNSSFLISPEGELLDNYRKRSLVIFGEYVPLERWLPFVRYLTPISGGFTPGTRSSQFIMPSLGVTASVLICFEDIFPDLAREGAQPDTDFLINLTNNGWFGDGAAQWQHAATAVFRAVENRIPLIRCCNNGLTCWIDPQGRIREIFRDSRGSEYGPGFLICEVPVLGPDELRTPSPYHRQGDRFGWACLLVAVIWVPIRITGQPAAS